MLAAVMIITLAMPVAADVTEGSEETVVTDVTEDNTGSEVSSGENDGDTGTVDAGLTDNTDTSGDTSEITDNNSEEDLSGEQENAEDTADSDAAEEGENAAGEEADITAEEMTENEAQPGTETEAESEAAEEVQEDPALLTEQTVLEEEALKEATNIADGGVYVIRSALNRSLVLDIPMGLMGNKTAVRLYGYGKSEGQYFKFKKNSDGTYTVTSFACDKALDVAGGSKANGAKVQIYTPNGTGAQKWKVYDNGDGTVTIMNAASKKVIDVPGAKAAENVNLNMYESNRSKAQRFVLEKVASPKHKYNGKFMIVSTINNNFVFDIQGGSKANGANLQIFKGNGTDAQWFNISYYSSGYYKITNVKSGRVLDVSCGRSADRTNVRQYNWNKSKAQLWRIQQNADGSVTFHSWLDDNKVLEIDNSKMANKTNVHIMTYEKRLKRQKFTLDKTGIISAGTQATKFKGLSEEKVVSMIGPLFTADQKKTGILACVSCAQFILESGYASTDLAQNANNCFGMKANLSGNTWSGSTWDGKSIYTKKTGEHRPDGTVYYITADFRKYKCVEDSIADHSAYLLGAKNGSKLRYAGLKGEKDYRKAITIIKNGGYATDTQYIQKICNIIERFNLTKYNA